jgi:hypothetical protein
LLAREPPVQTCRILGHPERAAEGSVVLVGECSAIVVDRQQDWPPMRQTKLDEGVQPLLGRCASRCLKGAMQIARQCRELSGAAANGVNRDPQSSGAACEAQYGVLELAEAAP